MRQARNPVYEKEWGDKFDPYDIPEGLDRELIYEALEPTKIYAKPIRKVVKHHRVKGAVHITGDAYLKFSRLMQFTKDIGFELSNFKPQPIFELIQQTAATLGCITDEEMLRTFNMGWGFAVVVDRKEQDHVLEILEKNGVEAELIGEATSRNKIVALYNGKKLLLK